MISALDTNILIDILTADPTHGDAAEWKLTESARHGAIVISEPVYAEMSPLFESAGALDRFLADTGIILKPSSREALHRAGRAWRDYTRQRPQSFACSRCGARRQVDCEACGARLQARQHVIADFLIGGHAVAWAGRLVTRDRRSYAHYFPELELA